MSGIINKEPGSLSVETNTNFRGGSKAKDSNALIRELSDHVEGN